MENYSARNKDVCSSNQDYVTVWVGNLILQCIFNCSKSVVKMFESSLTTLGVPQFNLQCKTRLKLKQQHNHDLKNISWFQTFYILCFACPGKTQDEKGNIHINTFYDISLLLNGLISYANCNLCIVLMHGEWQSEEFWGFWPIFPILYHTWSISPLELP